MYLTKIRALILAFQLAFIFCFFLSIFANNPPRITNYGQTHWYLINRGYPRAWAGTSLPDKKVDFPIIKAPFTTVEIDNNTFVKVIDLSLFIPMMMIAMATSFPFTWVFTKSLEKDKMANAIFGLIFFILSLLGVIFYFFWFLRI